MEISQRIIDYAIWYYLRYYPSPNKLRFKLKLKFWVESEKWKKYGWIGIDEIEYILNEKLKNIIQEEEVIKSKIISYKNKWKSKKYIISKMYERQENMDLVNNYLYDIFWEEWELQNLEKELKKQKFDINLDFEKKQKIFAKLMRKGYKYDDILKSINS